VSTRSSTGCARHRLLLSGNDKTMPIQALADRFLQTMQNYLPSQTLGSFNPTAI
jgi:hypothetical protein